MTQVIDEIDVTQVSHTIVLQEMCCAVVGRAQELPKV